jgi:hypothetical protein
MYLVAIAWIYVVLMMALAEALSPQGSVLGALLTALLYGALPLAIVLYIMGTPHRRRARLAAEAEAEAEEAEAAAATTPPAEGDTAAGDSVGAPPDGRAQPPADAVAPVRKET